MSIFNLNWAVQGTNLAGIMYDTGMDTTQEKIDQLAHRAYTQAIHSNSQQLATLLTRKEKLVQGAAY